MLKLHGDHNDAYDWVDHTRAVLTALSDIYSSLSDMETGQRGYLLTLDPAYLEPYETQRLLLPESMVRLRALVSDNPEQSRRAEALRRLAQSKADELAETLAAARLAGLDPALAIVRTDAGNRFMRAFRADVLAMVEAEHDLLRQRQRYAAAIERRILLVTGFMGALALAGLLLAGFRVLRESRVSGERLKQERRLREDLRQAKQAAERATRAKGHLLRATGHDLRQPLTVIAMAHAMLSKRATNAFGSKYLEWIGSALAHLTRQLDELSEVARIEAGGREPHIGPVGLEEVFGDIRALFEPLSERKGVTLHVVMSRAEVQTDRGMLQRIVENLVGNAIKYTDAGGLVLVGCRRRGQTVVLQVFDTGRGIPPETLTTIFEPYCQADSSVPGQGLGLWIVKQTAELLRHPIEARSIVGKGSCFSLELPVVSSPASTTGPARRPDTNEVTMVRGTGSSRR